MRVAVLLYDDVDSEVITPRHALDVLDRDIARAEIVLWIGISFAQSASCEYARRALEVVEHRGGVDALGPRSESGSDQRLKRKRKRWHIVVNPDEEAAFNLKSVLGAEHEERNEIRHMPVDADTISRVLEEALIIEKE